MSALVECQVCRGSFPAADVRTGCVAWAEPMPGGGRWTTLRRCKERITCRIRYNAAIREPWPFVDASLEVWVEGSKRTLDDWIAEAGVAPAEATPTEGPPSPGANSRADPPIAIEVATEAVPEPEPTPQLPVAAATGLEEPDWVRSAYDDEAEAPLWP